MAIVTLAVTGLSVVGREPSQSERARNAWPAYFKAFKSAVARKNVNALRPLLSKELFFSGGGGDDNHDGDTRDEAFAHWNDRHVDGWSRMRRALQHGTVPMARWWHQGELPDLSTRVAPPAANIRRNIDRNAIDFYAIFEFGADGAWRCTVFNVCCD